MYLGLRIVADPSVPEAGPYDKSGVHRGADWEPLTIVGPRRHGATDLSAVNAGLNTEVAGTLGSSQVEYLDVHGDQRPGQRRAEGRGRHHRRHSAAATHDLRSDGPNADPVG